MLDKLQYFAYRFKYNFAPKLNLSKPVDIALELASYCTNSCGYCLDPETPVLKADLSWVPIKLISAGDKIVAFDEYPEADNVRRKMRLAVVEKKWDTQKQSLQITTEHGSFICSDDHKFLDISARWTEAKNLSIGQKIKYATETWTAPEENLDYARGYLRAMTEGDGTVRWQKKNSSSAGRQTWWRVALVDDEPLNRCLKYLSEIGIKTVGLKTFQKTKDNYKELKKLEFRTQSDLIKLRSFLYEEAPLNHKSFELGYLAGAFDSEGSFSSTVRISQKNQNDFLSRCESYGKNFGFTTRRDASGIRIVGGLWENLRFLGTIGATIKRKVESFAGYRTVHIRSKILDIKPVGVKNLIDIQTSTKTFYAAGFPTHNCYHASKKTMPFKQGFMSYELAEKILNEASNLGVNSLKFNYRGESTMNKDFEKITWLAKKLAHGSTFIDRVTNSNFNFRIDREDIFRGLCNQTKVKVSFDSFKKDIFEAQRKGSKYESTLANIDKFYNYPGRDTILVVQSVRTQANKDEDLAHEIKSRWPSALVSIRDCVEGRVEKDLSSVVVEKRDDSDRQSCIQFHARLIVGANGIVSGCCPDIKQTLVIGDANTQSVSEIWNSAAAKAYRKSLLNKSAFKLDPCKSCSSFETYKNFKKNWDS